MASTAPNVATRTASDRVPFLTFISSSTSAHPRVAPGRARPGRVYPRGPRARPRDARIETAGIIDSRTGCVRRTLVPAGPRRVTGRAPADAFAIERTEMLPNQWDTFKRAARLEKLDQIPMALIVDSPWIPGYLGHQAHGLLPRPRAVVPVQPEDHARSSRTSSSCPSWWMEYGMAAEPSVLGAKIKFWQDNTPSEYHTLYRLEDIDEFPEYEVEADALRRADAAPHTACTGSASSTTATSCRWSPRAGRCARPASCAARRTS